MVQPFQLHGILNKYDMSDYAFSHVIICETVMCNNFNGSCNFNFNSSSFLVLVQQVNLLTPMDCAMLLHTKSTIALSIISRQ